MPNQYTTPQKLRLNLLSADTQNSGRRYLSNQTNRMQNGIDYKAKTFQLMQNLTEMQIKEKQSNRTIFYIQRQLQIIQKDLDQFLSCLGMNSLAEVKQRVMIMSQKFTEIKESNEMKQKPLLKEQKLSQEYDKILNQYKQIITTQQQKLVKYQNKWKQKQISLYQQLQLSKSQQKLIQQKLNEAKDKFEKENRQIKTNCQQQIESFRLQSTKQKQQGLSKGKQQTKIIFKTLEQQNLQYKNDLQMLKNQFRQIIIEKHSIEDKYQKLKKKYKQEIEHFELIQKQVEEKLIEVEKQIAFYKEQRQINIDQIRKLRQQNNFLKENYSKNQLEDDFSFGGYFNVQTQTQDRQDGALSVQCLQASCNSLIEENSRLKRILMLLDKSKKGQYLSPQVELELKLLKGLTQISSNTELHHNASTDELLQAQQQAESKQGSPTFNTEQRNENEDRSSEKKINKFQHQEKEDQEYK